MHACFGHSSVKDELLHFMQNIFCATLQIFTGYKYNSQVIVVDFTRKTFDVSRKSLLIWQEILVKLFLHMVYKECYFHIVLCTTYFYTLIKEWAAGVGDGKEKEGIYRCHH